MLTLHRRRTDGWACGSHSVVGRGARADGGGTGWGGGRDASAPWPAAPATLRRRPAGAGTRPRRGSGARPFPHPQSQTLRRRFRESDRCVGAIDAGNARAPFGWGTYVVDVRDDGHVTDVVLLVHLTTELVDRELRGEGERWSSGRRLAFRLLACRVAERRKKHMATSSVPASGRDATQVGRDARARASRALGTHLHHGCRSSIVGTVIHRVRRTEGSNADRRAFYRRRHTAAEKVSKYTQYSTSSDRKTLYKIYGLRFLIVPAVHPTFSNACVRVAAGRESLGPRMKSHASRLCKSAHLRRRLCHPAGAFRTHAPSNADARDVRR